MAESKERISKHYTEFWQDRTYGYEVRENRRVLVLGTAPTNIGGAIAMELEGAVALPWRENGFDVRVQGSYPDMSHYDTLVCCVGATNLDWIEDQSYGDIQRVIDTNLTGPVKIMKKFVQDTITSPYLKYIVFIGSMAHKNVLNGSLPYCASKAGLAHAVRCAGFELTPKGYRVFGVHPSNTQGTPMTEETIEGLSRYRMITREEAEGYWAATRMMPKWLQTWDIVRVVRFLVSGNADFLSGTNLDLSGGQR